MALRSRFPSIRSLLSSFESCQSSPLLPSTRSYYSGISNGLGLDYYRYSPCLSKVCNDVLWTRTSSVTLRSSMATEVPTYVNERRMSTSQVKAPPQARPMINILLAHGDKTTIRKAVTEKMYSELKNEIKNRESRWSRIYWEMVEPVVKIRTLRARLARICSRLILKSIGVDRNDLNKAFIQLTLEFLTKQKFEAYDSKGTVVAGNKNKEVLVRDIWVFEKSLFHADAFWRLCGRISLK
ncbi:unnamed protein product [Linum tenue]|uniref:Large ribosomal subunit protein mL45 n=1 Tax=Linum tenue TaxID=586396 RepID=A0AAV0I358_9ROSI|nr:unnamed protein product [Linum tenue]